MGSIKFRDLNLSDEIQKAVIDMGFEEATTIQIQSIPPMLEGKDVIGLAQTGTGKTAAFGITLLETINPENKALQAVILCPTRELAIQVAGEIKELAKYKTGVKIIPVYGGQHITRQIRALKQGVQIIIGTPGRVMDHLERRTLKMGGVKTIVLDEADEMLDMGFKEDIETILGYIPEDRQTLLFSATMSKAILGLTKRYQTEPVMIKLVHKEMTVSNVKQYYLEVKQQAKLEALSRLLDVHDFKLAIVFCNTKRGVDALVENLRARGYLTDGLHGDMDQRERDKVMSKLRRKNIEILVATDVAARGIDVDDIEAVFNYDVPTDDNYYVHRIGRTARAGKEGYAFSLVTGKEVYRIKKIQKHIKTTIRSMKVPSLNDVEEIRTNLLLGNIKDVVNDGHLGEYSNLIDKLIQEDYTYHDVSAGLLKMLIEGNKEEPRK